MMFATHIVIALMFYFLFMVLGVPFTLKADVIAAIIGSIIPDIDHPRSFISQANLLFSGASKAISQIGHRGVTHSITGCVVFSAIVSLIVSHLNLNPFVVFAFMLGYISHLVADSLNPAGVRWLQPFNNKFRTSGFVLVIRAGGMEEKIVFLISGILMLMFLYFRFTSTRF